MAELLRDGNFNDCIKNKRFFLYKVGVGFLIGLVIRIVLNYFDIDVLVYDGLTWLLNDFFVNKLCTLVAILPSINVETLYISNIRSSIKYLLETFHGNKITTETGVI